MHVINLHNLCHYYDLGTPVSDLIDVAGGFQHEIARLDTGQGSYALKRLQQRLVKQQGLHRFTANEIYASALQAGGIPACTALRPDAPLLTLAGRHYLVYPWLNGKSLAKAELTTRQAEMIGATLAAIHQFNYQAPQVRWPDIINLPDLSGWSQYKDWLKTSFLKTALHDSLAIIQDVIAAYRMMQPMLAQQTWVYSHSDLTPANVIWQSEQATLVDWESAGPIMPGQDVVATALNWSLDEQGSVRWPLFNAFLQGFSKIMPLPAISKMSIIATFIDWLNWIVFNLEQVFDVNLSEAVRARCARQAEYSLMALQQTYAVRNSLLN